MFPPLNKHFRFLLHQLVQHYFSHKFATISIGTEGDRRPVLYNKRLSSLQISSDQQGIDSVQLTNSKMPKQNPDKSKTNKKQNKNSKRPDMKLYVHPKSKVINGDKSDDVKAHIDDVKAHIDDDSKNSPIQELSNSSPIVDKICKEEKVNSTNEMEKPIDKDDQSWDALFDDNGDSIQPELLHELATSLSLNDSQIKTQKAKLDYNSYQHDIEIDNSEFSHILEVYDFPIELKTQDIISSLAVFKYV